MTVHRGIFTRLTIRAHRPVVAALAILAFVLGLLTCAQPAYAIHNGVEATAIRGEVQFEVAGGYRCTGTVIDPMWVLTAKHCITESPAATPDNTVLRFGTVTRGRGFQRAGIQFVLHPSLDSALVKLNVPVPNPLVVRVGTGELGAPDGGDPHPTVTVSGWGETNTNPGQPTATMRTATMTTETGTGVPPDHYRLVPKSDESGLPAGGDSGAGVMYYGVECGQIEEGSTLGNFADAVTTDALATWLSQKAHVSIMQNACSGSQLRTKVLRVMSFGDSITYGIGSSDGNGYRARLQTLLSGAGALVNMVGSQRSGQMGDNENEGHPGYTIDQLVAVAKTEVDDYRPNVITMHVGTNDMNDDIDPAGAPDRLSHLLDTVFAADPDVTVVLSSLIPSRLSATEQRIQQFNAQLPDFVSHYNYRHFSNQVVFDNMDSVQAGDLVDDLHPDDAGYAKMAGVFADGVETAVSYGFVANRPAGGVTGTPGPDPSLGRWSDQGVIAGGVGADPNSTLLRFADIDGDGRDDYLVVDKHGAVDAWRNEGLISSTSKAAQRRAAGPSNAPPVKRSAGATWGWYHVGTIAHGIGSPGDEIKFADINGDGRADYLAVHADGSVTMYLNGGYIKGKWDWIDYGTIKIGIGEPGGDIQFADLNGDGRADYLYVNPTMGAIHMLQNDGGTAGHWNWTDRGVIATGTFSNADYSVQMRDINNDGFADYLYISKKNGTVQAYTNHGVVQSGKWDWVPQGQVAPGTGAASADHRVYEADVDADGRADYLSVDRFGAVHAYLDEGRDQTSVADWLPKGQIAGGIGVAGADVRMADLDDDGLDDYLAVHPDGSVTAYLNGGSKPDGGWDWIDRGTVFTPPKSTSASQVQFADVNHDGRADALVVSSGGRTGVWLNESKATTVSPGDFHFLTYESTDALAGEGGIENGGRVVFADIDGDGYSDYAMIRDNSAVDFARNGFADGSNEFEGMSWRVANGVGVPGQTVRLADVDGDGRADYLVIGRNGDVRALFNKPGVNQYSASWISGGIIAYGVGSSISQVQFADIDGDGRADYLVIGDNGSVTAYLNNRG